MQRNWHVLVIVAVTGSAIGCKSIEARLFDDAAVELKCDRTRLKVDQMTGRDRDTEDRGFLTYCFSAPLDTTILGPGGGGPTVTAWASFLCPSLQKANSTTGVLLSRCKLVRNGSGEPGSEQDLFASP